MDNQIDIQDILKNLRDVIGQQAIDIAILKAQLDNPKGRNDAEQPQPNG